MTTKKKSTLILNVDGAIGCAFVDLLRSCGAFTLEEVRSVDPARAPLCPVLLAVWFAMAPLLT